MSTELVIVDGMAARRRAMPNGAHRAAAGALHVAGQIGWNAHGVFEAKDLVGQFAQALDNVLAVLARRARRTSTTSPR